jgi:hypothetical protein
MGPRCGTDDDLELYHLQFVGDRPRAAVDAGSAGASGFVSSSTGPDNDVAPAVR